LSCLEYAKFSNIHTVFLLINAPGRDAKHNEGASILTLKHQNTITKKTPFFSQNKLISALFTVFLKPVFTAQYYPYLTHYFFTQRTSGAMSSAIYDGFRLSFWLKKNVTSQKIEGGGRLLGRVRLLGEIRYV